MASKIGYTTLSSYKRLSTELKANAAHACTSCEKLIETPLVCSECNDVLYCDEVCQQNDLYRHLPMCSHYGAISEELLDYMDIQKVIDELLEDWKQKKRGLGFFYTSYDPEVIKETKNLGIRWVALGSPEYIKLVQTAPLKLVHTTLSDWLACPSKNFELYVVLYNKKTHALHRIKQDLVHEKK